MNYSKNDLKCEITLKILLRESSKNSHLQVLFYDRKMKSCNNCIKSFEVQL